MSRWEEAAIDVDQRWLTLNCIHEDENINVIALADVPSCVRRKTGTAQTNENNKFTLVEFLSARREMVLNITNDVKVRVAESSPRQREILEDRLLQRSINLIDVAAKFCVVFTEQAMGDYCHLPFLGAYHDSLRCIYAVALMLRGLVEAFLKDYFVTGTYFIPHIVNDSSLEYCNMSLEYLLPAASVRKRLLSSRCLRLGSQEFKKMSMPTSSEMSADTELDRIDVQDQGVELL